MKVIIRKLLCLAVLILTIQLQNVQAQPQVSSTYRMEKGQQFVWESQMSVYYEQNKVNIRSKTDILQTVHDKSSDGIVDLVSTVHFEVTSADMGGKDMLSEMGPDAKSLDVIRQSVELNGKIVETSKLLNVIPLFRLQKPFINLLTFKDDTPIEVGSKWKDDILTDFAKIKAEYTVIGLKDKGKYNCAEVKADFSGELYIGGPVFNIEKGEGTFYFAMDEGVEVESNSAFKVYMVSPNGERASFDIGIKNRLSQMKNLTPEELERAKTSEKLLERGLGHLYAGSYEIAKGEFERFIAENGDSVWISDVRELLNRVSKPWVSANQLSQLRLKGELTDLLANARRLLDNGTRYEKQTALEEVITAYTQYEKIGFLISALSSDEYSDNIGVQKILGQAYARQKDYENAIKAYEKVLSISADDIDAIISVGEIYQLQKDYTKAIDAYLKALNSEPEQLFLYPLLADAYVNVNKRQEALKLVDQLIDLARSKNKSDSAYLNATLGDIYLIVKDYDKAIEYYTKTMQLDPRSEGYVKGRLIQAYEGRGDIETANKLRESMGIKAVNMVGKQVPQFILRDAAGSELKPSDIKGKVVIIDFWATWCPHCVKEIPAFVELYKKYKEKGLVIIGISTDEDRDVVQKFVEKYKVNYPIVMANDEIQSAFGGIDSIPTTFVVDKQGVIQRHYVGYREKSVFEKDIETFLDISNVK